MTDIIDIPLTVTASCPIKGFKQRYIHKGCLKCEYYKGIAILTESEAVYKKDEETGEQILVRLLEWHERFLIRCAWPTTRRCSNIEIVED